MSVFESSSVKFNDPNLLKQINWRTKANTFLSTKFVDCSLKTVPEKLSQKQKDNKVSVNNNREVKYGNSENN